MNGVGFHGRQQFWKGLGAWAIARHRLHRMKMVRGRSHLRRSLDATHSDCEKPICMYIVISGEGPVVGARF